ncbi:MAG TPA: hypothetical protein PKB10_01675 [Tepidisphaeraceae bacterium]|nr:hypothetical protein [Tepidisphaeraceae bacterium]
MKRRFRWCLAVAAVIAGFALIALELARPARSPIDQWFWQICGVLVLALGVFECYSLFTDEDERPA